jgi:hypothetical protein
MITSCVCRRVRIADCKLKRFLEEADYDNTTMVRSQQKVSIKLLQEKPSDSHPI